MCGIAGYIGKKKISKKKIFETLNLMKNRGPDFQSHTSFSHNNFNISLLLILIFFDSSFWNTSSNDNSIK